MTILNDTAFHHAVRTRLEANGWTITDSSRYNPTRLVGVTPTGRAFTAIFTMDGTAEIDVAGRTRSVSTGNTLRHEDGAQVVEDLLTQWNRLPANQQ